MIEVSLEHVSVARGDFALHDITFTFPASTHTAISGPPSSGASTLLEVIAGRLRPETGEVRIGARPVNDLKESQRPLLFVTAELDVPARWSVQHALIAAVRHRTLDRVDRHHEYNLAVEKWELGRRVEQTMRTLSSTERTLVLLARIELLRPGILVADRVLERLNPAAAGEIADRFYRTLRVAGTTVISAPAHRAELGSTDRVVVLDEGRIVQEGTAAQVHAHPAGRAAAVATAEVNIVPVRIERGVVESVIGSWEPSPVPFEGAGVAIVRPDAFSLAAPGQESDLIVGVEEASFQDGRWLVRAILTGGFILRVSLPAEIRMHKGKLLALRYDPAVFTLERSR